VVLAPQAPQSPKEVLTATEDHEPEAGTSSDDPALLGQLPTLAEGRSAAEVKERMRKLSESALGSRGLERPAAPSNALALTELQRSTEPDTPE
jgi:hypothetical protein